MASPTLGSELARAVGFAAGLNSSTSARWPVHLEDWAIGEIIILVINKHGQPQVFQREWRPSKLWPQRQQILVASIFHVDDLITVVMADGFEDLIERDH